MKRSIGELVFAFALVPLLGAALSIGHRVPFWEHAEVLLPMLLGAGAAWIVAILLAVSGRGDWKLVVIGACLLRVLGLGGFPDLSDDIHRYVWEGELIAGGTSPYAFAPSAAELAAERAELPEVYRAMNNTDISAAYPPLTQYANAAVVALARAIGAEPIGALRCFFALCDLLVLIPLALLLKRAGRSPALLVVWAWCPLVTLEFSGSGHFDSLGILLLLSALALCASTAARALGWACLSAAIVVKYLPVVALPFVALGRPMDSKRLLGVASTYVAVAVGAALFFVPILFLRGGSSGWFAGLGEYGLRWQSGGWVYSALEPLFDRFFENDESLLDARRLSRLTLGLVWLAVGIRVWRRGYDPVRATGILLATFLVLTPTLHPWYVTWILPFVALRPHASWIWLAATIPGVYAGVTRWKLEGEWGIPFEMQVLIAVPFFLFLLYELRAEALASRTP